MDVGELSLVPALEEDRAADASLGAEIELDPRLLRLAVGLPVCTHVAIGHRFVQGWIPVRGSYRNVAVDRDLADGRDVLCRALHLQYDDGRGCLHIIGTDVHQQRMSTLRDPYLAAIQHTGMNDLPGQGRQRELRQ